MEVPLLLSSTNIRGLSLSSNVIGGYNLGQAYDRFYDPEGLVLESVTSGHPVIYVAIHYRVASMLLCRHIMARSC